MLLGTGSAALLVAVAAWQARPATGSPAGDRPPVCCFDSHCMQQSGFTKLLQCEGAETTYVLDASESYDPEGHSLSFEWTAGPGATLDDAFAAVTTLRIDTSSNCDRNVPLRVAVSDGTHTVYCRLYIQVVLDEVICGARPASIDCVYTGEDCSASHHGQEDAFVTCSGDPAFAGPVHIKVTHDTQPTRVYFDGIVDVGGVFTIDGEGNPSGKVPPNSHVEITDLEGQLLQDITFHTSCSQPLDVGDQFGSLFLIDFTP
jgi:hypothetical protein